MHAEDFPGIRSFYSEVIGFEEVESDADTAVFHLGDNTYLELRPGGRRARIPDDRVEVTNSFILRLKDTERFKTTVKALDVPFVNEHIQWKRAHLAYFSDPEGRITGIEQRYAPGELFLSPWNPMPKTSRPSGVSRRGGKALDKVVQGLGWFVRRTADPIALGRFYERALGLPRLRSWESDGHAGAMYWAGEVCAVRDQPDLRRSSNRDAGESVHSGLPVP